MRTLLPIIFAAISVLQSAATEPIPRSPEAQNFEALNRLSPFSRSINLSDSLVLTGVAMADKNMVATLVDRQTKETFVVSDETNSQGWRMVELSANVDLELVAARIAIEGGEVFTVRYEDLGLKDGEARPGGADPGRSGIAARPDGKGKGMKGKGREGGRSGGPPPEMREKLSQLSDDQRGQLFQRMMQLRQQSPDMSREERGKIFQAEIEKLSRR
ncbi:MAG: hypothetical protein AAF236_03815 [Verrucomicrobiota bacterium]